MGVLRHHRRGKHHHHHYYYCLLPTVTFLLFSCSALAITTLTSQPSVGAVNLQGHMPEEKEKGSALEVAKEKRFGGPGSSPPSCRSKCGWCSPCQPVHVPVQPGLIISLEYYPEAWRCKCGNKLYMP